MATQKEGQNLVFKTDYRLMQVKSIAECSKGSILQYFRPPLLKLLFVVKTFDLSIFEWLFLDRFYCTNQKVNNKGTDQTAHLHRLVCTFVVPKQQSQIFSRQGPYNLC